MSEQKSIDQTDAPLTIATLTAALRQHGMVAGHTVLVHLSMSKLGWIPGGPQAVIMALKAAVGDAGTLMMVTNSNGNTDPSEWQHPPVPEAWWPIIRAEMPAYDPARSPSRGLGVVPELFRTWPGVIRSGHPAFSLAAWGPNARFLTDDHSLDNDTGDQSPVGRLYELDGHVLLLGVDHFSNTSLHLAEYRANYRGKRHLMTGSAMLVDGQRQWVTYRAIDTEAEDFGAIGQAFDAAHGQPIGTIGQAEVRYFRQRPLVDFAVTWLEANRHDTRPID